MTNEDEPLVLELSPTVNDVDLDLIEIKLPLLNPTWVNESKICNICGKTVKTEKGLKRHLKIHNLNTHQVFCQRKQRVNKVIQINDDIEIIEVTTKASRKKTKMYNCSQCTKKFKHVSNFYRHGQTHSKERIDSYRNKRKSQSQECNNLLIHKTKKKSVACDICCKTFYHKGNLTRHMNIHSGVKPYSCSVCQKDFARKDHLKWHMRTHTNEKPVVVNVKQPSCSVCKKDFSTKSSLNRHMRLVHTNEKPYKCPHCAMSFKYLEYVKRHLKNNNACAIMEKWKDLNSV